MRIQNIIRSLTSRWFVFTYIMWLILLLSIFYCGMYGYKYINLKHQRIQLNNEIKMLVEKKEYVQAKKEGLNLDDVRLSAILSDLLSVSKKSGARLGETEVSTLIERDNYKAFPVTISIKGSYNQIGRFVNLVEKNLRFEVQEVNLSTKETKGIGIVCEIKAEFIIL